MPMKESPLPSRPTSRDMPPVVHATLRSPGRPLDEPERAFMEPRLGHDFGRVRVHDDAQAAESAKALNALAYTVGHNIVFGAMQYSPETTAGQKLLAHELAHVVQQNGSHRQILQRSCAAHPKKSYYLTSPDYCQDTKETGKLHPNQDCFREIPKGPGCPPGEHVCFDKTTGTCNDHIDKTAPSISRDPATGLCNLKWLGGCSIVHGLKDVVGPRMAVEGSLHGGGGGLLGAGRGTAIVGADAEIALNRIFSLRLGARGVYLSPDYLFAGGTVGARARLPSNPLFFDLDAGFLGEIPVSDRERFSKDVSGFISAGTGLEFGRRGTRFFLRAGGFVIISDRGPIGGGGTFGLGIRFSP
jgi:hypothetical protein